MTCQKELDVAWTLIDEVLNVLLFMLISFEILEVTPYLFTMLATLAVIPLYIAVRAIKCVAVNTPRPSPRLGAGLWFSAS